MIYLNFLIVWIGSLKILSFLEINRKLRIALENIVSPLSDALILALRKSI
jgi:hypothetical protein